jgi:hypothetical protein
LLDEKREDLFTAVQAQNSFLICRKKAERSREGSPFYLAKFLPDRHLTRPGSACFPITLKGQVRSKQQQTLFDHLRLTQVPANLSGLARKYLAALGIADPDANEETAGLLAYHTLAIGYSPEYLAENEDGIKQDWPRIPLPASEKVLRRSAGLGQKIAALLDTAQAVAGITNGQIRPEYKVLGVMSRVGGGPLDPASELAINVGWGYAGQGGVTMPGQGRLVERVFTPEERGAIEKGAAGLGISLDDLARYLGEATLDVYLNETAYWSNIPLKVWEYTIGGYQVIKKWLSYREEPILGRPLKPEEAHEVIRLVRRLTAIILLEPALDANYRVAKQSKLM